LTLFDLDDAGDTVPGYLSAEEFIQVYRRDKPERIAFDTESPTYKWHLKHAVPFALTFSWGADRTFYVPCALDGELIEDAANALHEVLVTAPILIGHHIKYDLHVAKRILDPFGLPLVVRRIDDTMIMSAVLNENRYHGLKELCTDLCITWKGGKSADEYKKEIQEWIEKTSRATKVTPGYDEVPKRLMVPYAMQDAYLTLELFSYLSVEMDEQVDSSKHGRDVRDIYELELDVLWVLFQMEERGMRIDLDFVFQQIAAMQPRIEDIKTTLSDALGWEMNPGSTDDVARALKELGRVDALWTNPKTGKINLPEWRLSELENDPTAGPIVKMVLEYRTAAKMLNSYYEVLAKEHKVDDVGQAIVRCNNKQTGARTGRMSVTEPALQTIPREKGEVRGAFIAREGHKLIFADYSQQELRVLAHYMASLGDYSMSDIFAGNVGKPEEEQLDLHRETASAMFERAYDDVSKEQRRLGKNTNFAIVYGAGIKKIASMHGVDDSTAKQRLNRMYNRFPGISKLKRVCERAMGDRGYVVTAFGRRHRETDGRYAYKAVNSLVQGTSADITKAAAVKIDKSFRDAGMTSMILLMVHDEIIVEAPDEEVEEATRIIREAMLDLPEINVPMEVEMAVADRWSDAK
jgi:DNA polymerase-1